MLLSIPVSNLDVDYRLKTTDAHIIAHVEYIGSILIYEKKHIATILTAPLLGAAR